LRCACDRPPTVQQLVTQRRRHDEQRVLLRRAGEIPRILAGAAAAAAAVAYPCCPPADDDFQGQFFPVFVLTLTGLVTLPLTYTLLFPTKDIEAKAPRIKSDFKPKDANLIQAQRNAQKRRQRRVTRAIFVLAGWALMAGMVYLIINTQRTVPKIWNPYDILGISEVGLRVLLPLDHPH
jgi:hypothetical protein